LISKLLRPIGETARQLATIRRLPDVLAWLAACVFVFTAAYRIKLPGLYMDELFFVNAAQGAPDNITIYKRLGSVPLFIGGYLGALKAWIYTPIFAVFGVSALTVRLPAILIAAVTMLTLYYAVQPRLGKVWAAAAIWLMAVDPVNLFLSRLDWGPVVLMHFFQAAIIALCFSYFAKPELWKPALILLCFGLGFFDKFNFIWLILAVSIGVCACYPGAVKQLWNSTSKITRLAVAIVLILSLTTALCLIIPIFRPLPLHDLGSRLYLCWAIFQSTFSGTAVAIMIFESPQGILGFLPSWLVRVGFYLLVTSLFCPMAQIEARDNKRNGVFCWLIALLVFAQIVATPRAGGAHHFSMIFPLPLIGAAFLARSLYLQLPAGSYRRVFSSLVALAAAAVFLVNVHNTGIYLAHFRSDPHYRGRWSPAIYELADYINQHGPEAEGIISTDWGTHFQLHALAPKSLRGRLHDWNPTFNEINTMTPDQQNRLLNRIFPAGKSLAITFAAGKETFPATRRNFLALLGNHHELTYQLTREFWYGGEKIYEVYEVARPAQN
jgi:hypothetical protein